MPDKNIIILTGLPGAGKSTIAENIVTKLITDKHINAEDVYGYKTLRLLDDAGRLSGFKITVYGGEKCLLASVSHKTHDRYMGLFVNKSAFEITIAKEFDRALKAEGVKLASGVKKNGEINECGCEIKSGGDKFRNLILHIDEIGLMEKISSVYMRSLVKLFENFRGTIIAVVKLIEKDDFLDGIKELPNAKTYMVNKDTRAVIEKEVYDRILKNMS